MRRVAILSDTHGLLREDVKEVLRSCEVIMHAGDINRQEIIDEMQNIAPVYVVRGNADKEWAEDLPQDLTVTYAGFRFYMVHDRKKAGPGAGEADIVIFGHSHRYEDRDVDGVRWLNPGSCGPRRFYQAVTMMVLELDEEAHAFAVQRVDLSSAAAEKHEMPDMFRDELERLVESIMKNIDDGKTIEWIAKKNKVSWDFADQVCRMYLTHPGVNVDGILSRIDSRKQYVKQ